MMSQLHGMSHQAAPQARRETVRFDPSPVHPIDVEPQADEFVAGWAGFADVVLREVTRRTGVVTVAIDGMWGIDWADLVRRLSRRIEAAGLAVRTVTTLEALRPADELFAHFHRWLGDNPVFGRVCDRPLDDYFDLQRLEGLVRDALDGLRGRDGVSGSSPAVCLVAGPGALRRWASIEIDVAIYCDLGRETIVARQMEGLANMGDDRARSASEKYKIGYYVEWPIQERHKRALLVGPEAPVQLYVDCNDPDRPKVLSRRLLSAAIERLVQRPFRCKPVFLPGVWGGQRIKEAAHLPADWPNCAWDYEIVAPENSVLLRIGQETVHLPFHLVVWSQAEALLGPTVHRWFGEYFPIRFNYDDTMGGSNLSLQVHPHHTYIRQQFNEPLAQDESYYVVEHRPGSKVYLGFRDDIRPEEFREAVRLAEERAVPFDITRFVNAWEARPGDLFLIPSGTVHCSGADNLVLEISSTPYWYTFKIYDYLRPDLNGKPRPINSEHAWRVLDFTRTTRWVKENLIQSPLMLRAEPGGRELLLGSTPMTFYGVNRLEVEDEMIDDTRGGVLVLAVTAGEGVLVVSERDPERAAAIAYLEAYIVPASFGRFRVLRLGDRPCHVVKAYVKQ